MKKKTKCCVIYVLLLADLLFFLQSFVVSLVNPQDGVVIGDMSSVTVTINRNDDINGVFIFDMDSVLVSICNAIINESFTVMFSVTRIPKWCYICVLCGPV